MATYHCSIKTGGKGTASDHADYILREGRFADVSKYGALEASGHGNMPEWARENLSSFWTAADTFERVNGNAYREFELALPRELAREHQIALAQRFIEQELGTRHAYQWALHIETASDGQAQPHVHVMFSDRMNDGIERGADRYFRRGNSKTPENGGCLKRSYGETKHEASQTYHDIRKRWGQVQNLALESHGIAARVDHRSLAAQGIRHREPGLHQGPAVAGIEGRGERSEVGQRQRKQVAERQAVREQAIAQEKQREHELERQVLAAERVAARERRALAPLAATAPKEDRAELSRELENDRQAQLERTAVAAERRTERREEALVQAKPEQLSLFTRLVDQARALQQRIGQAYERVKDWVQEKFWPERVREREMKAGKAEQAERKRALNAEATEPVLSAPQRLEQRVDEVARRLAAEREQQRTVREAEQRLELEREKARALSRDRDHTLDWDP